MTKQLYIHRYSQIERHVAERLRRRRTELGLSPKDVDRAIEETPDAVAKFEGGTRRLSASHLYRLSLALGVETTYFFEGLAEEPFIDLAPVHDPAILEEVEVLVRAYYDFPDGTLRRTFSELIKSLDTSDSDR